MLATVLIARPAMAQSVSITSAPDLGNVAAAGSGTTVFNFSASSGAVTRVSGSGGRVSMGATNALITLNCSAKWCNNNILRITVTNAGSPTGRAGALTDFTASMGNAVLSSGSPGTPANPLVFYIQGMGGSSRTFTIGADFPILGDDSGASSGAASSSFLVTMADTNKSNSASNTGTAYATVFHRISIGVATDPGTGQPYELQFGRIVRPASGSGTVAIPASTGARTASGAVALSSPAPERGAFTVTGEGGQTISVSVPGAITVSNTGPLGGSLAITTSNTAQGTQALTGSLGGTGAFTFFVGGYLTLSSTTPNGAYQGTYTVSVSYN